MTTLVGRDGAWYSRLVMNVAQSGKRYTCIHLGYASVSSCVFDVLVTKCVFLIELCSSRLLSVDAWIF